MIYVVRIAGEGIDADLIESAYYSEPSYPICPSCEEESDDDSGWCSACEQFADGRLIDEPLSELKRTGTGGWL